MKIIIRFAAIFALAPLLGGCMFLKAPKPAPIMELPKRSTKPVFYAADYSPRGTPLNKENDAVLPDYFVATPASSGDTLVISSVNIVIPTPIPVPTPAKPVPGAPPATPAAPQLQATPQPITIYGTPDPVRLAGIVAPRQGQPGYQECANAAYGWTVDHTTGKQKPLQVDQDPKFPTDVDGMRLTTVFFKGQSVMKMDKKTHRLKETNESAGKDLCLNRMLVRSGFAVVDLYSPTSFNHRDWLLDEAFARKNGWGLWGMGISIQQRGVVLPKVSKVHNPPGNIPVLNPPRPKPGTHAATPTPNGATPATLPAAAPAPVASAAAPPAPPKP